ncbi:hypothetical protein [uncultured Kordia sp.]|uniref:hypothetical protein n=1 Tax=uncultured Kordia sp. TaxID=507699 RepID=UPI002633AE7C|nr:hypothetical protein [uncultured Kordia sp.]
MDSILQDFYKNKKITHFFVQITQGLTSVLLIVPYLFIFVFYLVFTKGWIGKSVNYFKAYGTLYSFSTWLQLGIGLVSLILCFTVFKNYGFDSLSAQFIGYYLVLLSALVLIALLFTPFKSEFTWTSAILNEKLLLLITTLNITIFSIIGYTYLTITNNSFGTAFQNIFDLFFRIKTISDFVFSIDTIQKIGYNIETLISIHGLLFYAFVTKYTFNIVKLRKSGIDHLNIAFSLIFINKFTVAENYLEKNRKNFTGHYYFVMSTLKLSQNLPQEAVNSMRKFINEYEDDAINDVIYLRLVHLCLFLRTPDEIDINLLELAKQQQLKSYTYSIIKNNIEQANYANKISFKNYASKSLDSLNFEIMSSRFSEIVEGDYKETSKEKFEVINDLTLYSFNQACVKFHYLISHGASYSKAFELDEDAEKVHSYISNEIEMNLKYMKQDFDTKKLSFSNCFFFRAFVTTNEYYFNKGTFKNLKTVYHYLEADWEDYIEKQYFGAIKGLLSGDNLFKEMLRN